MPVRSPLTSAMNTGTPMREKRSASTCSVTVLPVPVAPVMQPWRLASAGSSARSVSPDLAMIRGSAMGSVTWMAVREWKGATVPNDRLASPP
jgi:hypothetical protein